ncbi:hypothetical protein L211DRAFT_854935 [Terfezia boudieri ATCC MYA-4762]|uniref:Uncharacterized protein n=1 Tax=Terfezia boudieri ATCC MYA-4762 TaxID=1051890 RepID=A0A3N4MCV9_9PEZI|nr:hypothetical protein L211DRAFT_854935 [Terfezia boudieri ATCC MYA-4762]
MSPPAIANPRRILLVGAPNSGKLTILKELTGSLPTTTQSQLSHAGLSHTLSLKTNYYEADIPIWVDEWIEEGPAAGSSVQPISTSTSKTEFTSRTTTGTSTTTITALTTSEATSDLPGPASWAKNYHNIESKPVLCVLGGFILCFRKPPLGTLASPLSIPETLIEAIRAVGSIIRACGSSWDGVALAVGMPSDGVIVGSPTGIDGVWAGEGSGSREEEEDVLSDLCQQSGFEYVDYEKKGRNEYGERQGVERVREALEANDWDNSGNDGDLGFDDDEVEDAADADAGVDERGVLGSVAGEFEQEMFGLRQAIERGGSSGGGLDGLFDGLEKDDDDDDGEERNEEGERKQVEDMERMMMKMATLRDLDGEDGEKVKRERRKLAQELLREIMMEGEVLEEGSGGR